MRKYRVSEYVHKNLETLNWVIAQFEQDGSKSAIYKALYQWSDSLHKSLPPYGDLAFFVSNGYMEQLAKVKKDTFGHQWFDYIDGYIPRLDYETDQMVMYAEGGWEKHNKAKYEKVHLFVTECIAVDLMR